MTSKHTSIRTGCPARHIRQSIAQRISSPGATLSTIALKDTSASLKTTSNHHIALPEIILQVLKLHALEDSRFSQRYKDAQLKFKVLGVPCSPASVIKDFKARSKDFPSAACKMLKQQIEEAQLQVDNDRQCSIYHRADSTSQTFPTGSTSCTCLSHI